MGDWTAAEVAKAILSEYHLGQTWAAIEELRSLETADNFRLSHDASKWPEWARVQELPEVSR